MKRTARRHSVELTPAQREQLRTLQTTVLANEKAELSRAARSFQSQQRAAEVELARAAELLRAERQEQGLSLADVHEKSGINRAAICRLENLVDANPTVATLDRMAAALGKKLVIALRDR
jgi:ribosome-binding protein aMBF1 (putative translation factor)